MRNRNLNHRNMKRLKLYVNGHIERLKMRCLKKGLTYPKDLFKIYHDGSLIYSTPGISQFNQNNNQLFDWDDGWIT